ncbi:MAG: hypothetical protein F4097_03370 [Cenarchaeum sp. SB0672_bin_9]|nr:hypothetical protein [Cenarchaeum sp. SB0672_bin_9]
MTLETLRKKVLFHNSVDVWIEYCSETEHDWNDTDGYGKFIKHLLDRNLNLKSFNLCAHESGDTQLDKKEFAEKLANLKQSNPKYATYTLRLNSEIIDAIRALAH